MGAQNAKYIHPKYSNGAMVKLLTYSMTMKVNGSKCSIGKIKCKKYAIFRDLAMTSSLIVIWTEFGMMIFNRLKGAMLITLFIFYEITFLYMLNLETKNYKRTK